MSQQREQRLLARERHLLVLKRQARLRQALLLLRARQLRAQPMLLQPPAWQMRRASGQTSQMKKW